MRSLLLRNGLVAGRRQDLALREGRIHRIGPDLEPARFDDVLDVADRLVLPGFVETHIHPDKAFIADLTHGLRAGGPSPQTLVAELKKAFTVDDIYARARRVLEAGRPSRLHDHARHVEVDRFWHSLAVVGQKWAPRWSRVRPYAEWPPGGSAGTAR